MEQAPVPPHERTWRHPSELAAEEHALARAEPGSASTRAFAFTTGTLGLLAVGLLVLAVTPSRTSAPVAISATTTPGAVDPPATAAAVATSETTPIGLRRHPDVSATPIGEGRLAIVTLADLASTGAVIGSSIAVAVPSGRTHDALVVALAGDTVVVELERVEPGVQLADEQPAGHEVVTVLAEPPVTIVFDDIASLDVEEGTAVLDETGQLVGLCSQDGDEVMRVVAVDGALLTTTGGHRPERSPDASPAAATTGG